MGDYERRPSIIICPAVPNEASMQQVAATLRGQHIHVASEPDYQQGIVRSPANRQHLYKERFGEALNDHVDGVLAINAIMAQQGRGGEVVHQGRITRGLMRQLNAGFGMDSAPDIFLMYPLEGNDSSILAQVLPMEPTILDGDLSLLLPALMNRIGEDV